MWCVVGMQTDARLLGSMRADETLIREHCNMDQTSAGMLWRNLHDKSTAVYGRAEEKAKYRGPWLDCIPPPKWSDAWLAAVKTAASHAKCRPMYVACKPVVEAYAKLFAASEMHARHVHGTTHGTANMDEARAAFNRAENVWKHGIQKDKEDCIAHATEFMYDDKSFKTAPLCVR